MKRLLFFAAFAALATAPCLAPAQSTYGVGPHEHHGVVGQRPRHRNGDDHGK
jgi:hypothetical protein